MNPPHLSLTPASTTHLAFFASFTVIFSSVKLSLLLVLMATMLLVF